MIRTWAPDDFWEAAQPLIPVPAVRPQGGGKRRADDRAVLAAIVYLVQAGCSWAQAARGVVGVSRATTHRRFAEWTRSGLWEQLHQQFLHRLNVMTEIDWSRARRGLHRRPGDQKGEAAGPNPVDRSKPGSKIHILCDRNGVPLTVLISATNVARLPAHDAPAGLDRPCPGPAWPARHRLGCKPWVAANAAAIVSRSASGPRCRQTCSAGKCYPSILWSHIRPEPYPRARVTRQGNTSSVARRSTLRRLPWNDLRCGHRRGRHAATPQQILNRATGEREVDRPRGPCRGP
jgi:transposase